MITNISSRDLILSILLEIENGENSHIVLKNVLNKFQYLPKYDRAFITRVVDGTLEREIYLDFIINSVSKVPVEKMKPVIRQILRSSVYQLYFMDKVPASAVCNEAVKLAQKKGFYSLKGFVNGVLRTIIREKDKIKLPDRDEDIKKYLSIRYSMPMDLVQRWTNRYGNETTEKMFKAFLEEKPITVRFRETNPKLSKTIEELRNNGVVLNKSNYLDYCYEMSNYGNILSLEAFAKGKITVQDVSSMLVAEIANPKKGDYIIDLCAAPGGKSLHLGDKMEGFGTVDARDINDYKVGLINENISRLNSINVLTKVADATVLDPNIECSGDIVIADVPCSGLGVLGKKPEIKNRITPQKIQDLTIIQRSILSKASEYVKSKGILIYSTCTITKEENEDNMLWFIKNFPFKLESISNELPEELRGETTDLGFIQLLPGVHNCDGFFIAKFRRN